MNYSIFLNFKSQNERNWTMVNFTSTQLETAKTVWNTLKQFGYNDNSTAGIIGNLYAESALNPNVNEHSGGGGYGLGQWTPKSNLYMQASICGISNSEAETVQGQAKIIAQGDITGQWLAYGNTAYHPTVKNYQVLSEFKKIADLTAAAANFCAHWERPNVKYAHMDIRIDATNSIYELLGTTQKNNKGEVTMQCFYQVKGSAGVYYFDGKNLTGLNDMDELNILNRIYKENNEKDMPYIVTDGAWFKRLTDMAKRPVNNI